MRGSREPFMIDRRRPLLAAALALVAATALAADRAKAEKALRTAVAANDVSVAQRACDELIEAGGKEGLAPILAELPRAQGDVYWQLVAAAAAFKDRPALDELGRFVIAHQADPRADVARDLLFGLQSGA